MVITITIFFFFDINDVDSNLQMKVIELIETMMYLILPLREVMK